MLSHRPARLSAWAWPTCNGSSKTSATRRVSGTTGIGWWDDELKGPNSKLQTPEKLQVSSSKPAPSPEVLGLGYWDLSGAWCLGFGVSLKRAQCSGPNTLARMASLIFQISDIVIAIGRRIRNSNSHWLTGSIKRSANTTDCGGCRTWERAK